MRFFVLCLYTKLALKMFNEVPLKEVLKIFDRGMENERLREGKSGGYDRQNSYLIRYFLYAKVDRKFKRFSIGN